VNKQVNPLRVLLLAGGVLVVLFLGYHFFLAPLNAYNAQINSLTSQLQDKQAEAARVRKAQAQVQRWKQESLPAPTYVAEVEYGRYLDNLRRQVKLSETPAITQANVAAAPQARPGAKKPVFTPVDFSLDFKTDLTNLVELLHRFQDTPLVQKIKNLKIDMGDSQSGKGKGKPGDLKVHLLVEGLVIDGADTEQPILVGADGHLVELDVLNALTGGPAFLGLLSEVSRPRDYVLVAKWNVFTGPQTRFAKSDGGVRLGRYVFLTTIRQEGGTEEALLRDRWNDNKATTLKAKAPSNIFHVLDSNGKELYKGEVLRIESRDVYFKVGWRIFDMHLGDNIAEAMRRPVPQEELRKMGLAEDVDE
jgi:hypothetical protein